MKNLLQLRKRIETITLKGVIVSDIFPLLTTALLILTLNIGIILLVGTSGRPGHLYEDGVNGIQNFPYVSLILTVGAAILLSRSTGPLAWVSAAVAIFIFAQSHYDSFLNGVLYGSILPNIVGILCTLLLVRIIDAIQTRALPGKLITLPAVLIYPMLFALFIAVTFLHRQ